MRGSANGIAVFPGTLPDCAPVPVVGVPDLLFRQKILGIYFLQQRVALVLLVFQNAQHHRLAPVLLSAGRGHAVLREAFRNGVRRVSFEKERVDSPHDLCLFLIDHQIAVRAAVVAERASEGHGDLAVSEALALTPDAVFGNAPAFLLRQRGHDGNHQLALAVEGPDILLFEAHLHAQPLQAAHPFQRVDGIPRKAREDFGENQVDFIRLFDTM